MKTNIFDKKDLDARSQITQVPIDEKEALGIQVSPTHKLDDIQSVTLKSFRKVVGYDTFNSILKGDRDEKKDPSDYYNVTVSMMVKRNTVDKTNFKAFKNSEGKSLSAVLDKGFPYDDADMELTGAINNIKKMPVGAVLGQLNGENVTKEALVNLIKDRSSPVTQSFLQIGSKKGDSDNLSSLFDTNVTRGALKNLVTDKPAPITVKLA